MITQQTEMRLFIFVSIVIFTGCSYIQYPAIRTHSVITKEGQGILTVRYDSIIFNYQPGFFEDSIRVLRFSVQRINMGFTILHGKWEEYILDNGGLLTYYYSGIIFLDSGGQRVWMRPHRLPDVETWKFLNNF
jgi:hypothetical protein